jgi:signal transduction histidine kinase
LECKLRTAKEQLARSGLRAKLGIAFILQAAAISCGAVLGVYAASAIIEDLLIKTALREEATHYYDLLAKNPQQPLPDTHNMLGYLQRPQDAVARLPADVRDLPVGFNTIFRGASKHLAFVSQRPTGKLVLLFDQSHVGRLAFLFGMLPLVMVLLFVYLTSFATYRLSKRAISPIIWLANEVKKWDPKHPDADALSPQHLPTDVEGESQVLGEALYGFSQRISEFVARERTFTRDASHELRSPLTVIKMAADVLLTEEDLDPYVEKNLRRIQVATKDMEALIEAFLILARDSSTGLPSEELSLNALIRDEVERAELLIGDKKIRLEFIEHSCRGLNAPAKVVGVMVGNLVRNACIYTDEGSVLVTLQGDTVTIVDTGPGMSIEDLGQVFQPFFRGPESKRGGHGVGLTIVRRMSDRFGWPIKIESQLGVGTRASIRFPASYDLAAQN